MNHLLLSIIVAFLDQLALTPTQTDEVIRIFGKLVDNIPIFLGLLGSGLSFLTGLAILLRQHLNKKDSDAKLAKNTKLTTETKREAETSRKEVKEALEVANGHNEKIAKSVAISEQVLAAVAPVIAAKQELGATAENPIHYTEDK